MAENSQDKTISEKYYRTILSASIDGFWVTDLQGHFLDINDSYCKLIGYSRDELLKMSISDVEAIEKPEETKDRIEKIIKFGGDRFETRHRCKNGRAVDMEISVNYTKEEGGQLFVFVRDITERKKAEQDLKKIKDELQFKVDELEKANKLMVGRELRMVEMKKEIEELKKKLGQT